MPERLTFGECRAESGRRIVGTALRFGERSPSHREAFEPGAFGSLADGRVRWLNLHHNPMMAVAWTDGGGLELRADGEAVTLSANVPPIPAGDLALRGLRQGTLGGLSIEFKAQAERQDGETRIVQRAQLEGVGLVAVPSYAGSLAEVRSLETRAISIRASVPYGRSVDCDCATKQGVQCDQVEFEEGAFSESVEAAKRGERDILAVVGNYRDAVASVSAGTLSLNESSKGLGIAINRLPDTQAAKDLREQAASVPIFARPYFTAPADTAPEIVEREGLRVAVYERADLRSVVLGSTDRAKGWEPIAISEAQNRTARRADDDYRRALLWL